MRTVSTPLRLIVGCALLAGCREAPGVQPRDHDITARDMRARISFLASDMLLGRATPSRGLDIAAQYVASEFRRVGLDPPKSGYVQRYQLAMTEMGSGWSLELILGSRRVALRHRTDFWGLPWAAGRIEGRLRFVGTGGPPSGGADREEPTIWVARLAPGVMPREWLQAAARAGVVGMIFLLPKQLEPQIEVWVSEGDAAYELADVEPSTPALLVSEEPFIAALTRLGLEAQPAAYPPESGGLGVRLVADLRVETAFAPNVVAILPGSDAELRHEFVLVSAHMDGLGVGLAVDGDSIYNGADDNASGTAALLEIAEAAASLEQPPKRSLVFIALSGEERGLLGSAWFVRNPPIPLERAVADINVDMVGRNWEDSIAVIGKPYSSLGATVDSVARAHEAELGLTAVGDLWPADGFFFRSDHFNFARVGIPAIFFFNGVHEDYHMPSDEVELISFGKAARVAHLIFETVLAVANAESPPRWNERARRVIVEGAF